MADTPETVTVNGRDYAWPDRPVVVVCIDGSEPDYIERAVADGAMPFLGPVLKTGSDLRADCVIPSFTNPNNMSIVTGVPPVVAGGYGLVGAQPYAMLEQLVVEAGKEAKA